MSTKLSNYSDSAIEYLKQCKDNDGLKALEDMQCLRKNELYRICIVGGFSRGKTRLINSILGTDIFPETVDPTTTILTEICYGEQPGITFYNELGSTDFTLSGEDIARFSAGGEYADQSGILRVRFSNAFLHPSLTLYDTPGVDDVLAQRANTTFKALEICDAALVVVSAMSPLGLSEKAFIDTYLCNRSMSRIALVITFLDKIPEKEAAKQILFITEKVRSLYPTIEIWCAHNISCQAADCDCQAVGIEAIRSRLRQWPVMPDTQALRVQHDLHRIQVIIQSSVARQQVLLSNFQGNISVRRKELEFAYEALGEESDVWQILRKDFLHNGAQASEDVQNAVDQFFSKLAVYLRQENLETFEASLRLRLQQASTELSTAMCQRVEQDVSALLASLKEKFRIDPRHDFDLHKTLKRKTCVIELPQKQEFGRGVESQLLDFAVTIIEQVVRDLPIPLPPQAKIILGNLLKDLLTRGQRLLTIGASQRRQQLDQFISEFCFQLEREIKNSVVEIYNDISDHIRNSQRKWIFDQQQKFVKEHDIDSLELEINSLNHTIDIGKELVAALNESKR